MSSSDLLLSVVGSSYQVSCSSADPAGQKEALRCLTVLGSVFPKKTLNFLAEKMDEVWNDKALVFHTIKILKVIISLNGLPRACDTCPGLEALNYRQGLLTKFLVIAAVWNTLSIRVAALELLGLVDSMIHDDILDLWLGRITLLLQYLKRRQDTFEQNEWENMLLLKFLYKCWGTAMKASRGTLIQPSLWRMVQQIRFYESEEREGFAYGLGISAIHHIKEVLSILDEYQSYIDQLLTEHYLMENTEVPVSKKQMRSILLLSYYFAAFLAPREVILPIMYSHIFPNILQNYPYCLKDALMKSAFIGSVILMYQATKEMDAKFSPESIPLIMNELKEILLETPTSCCEVQNCQKAIEAITLLWNTHALEKKEKCEIMELCISSIMKFPPWDILEKKVVPTDTLLAQKHYNSTFEAVYEIVKILMEQQMDPENLHSIIKALKNWLVSPKIYERERATRMLAQLLWIYRSQATVEMQQSVANVGHLIGLLLPNCVNKQVALCHWGKMAVACLLNTDSPTKIDISSTESIRIQNEEEQCLPSVRIFKTGMLIIKHLTSEELMPFIRTSLDGMLQDECWSEAVVDILKMVLKYRAAELKGRVEILVYSMYYILYSSDKVAVKMAIRSIIAALVHVEPRKTVNTLLTFTCPDLRTHLSPLPQPILDHQGKRDPQTQYEVYTQRYLLDQTRQLQHPTWEDKPLPEIRGLWMSLAADYMVFPKVLGVLLSKIPQKSQETNRTPEISSYLPNAIIAVIWHFIAVLERKELLEGKEDTLFFHCFLYIPGASTQKSIEKISTLYRSCSPCSTAVQALQNILRLAGCEHHLLEAMDQDHGWEQMVDAEEQHKGFAALGRATRNCVPGFFPRKVIPDFLPNLCSQKEACRLDCAAFFAEFLGSPHRATDEKAILKKVYNTMKWLLYDKNDIIRMYGMRGLVNAIHTLPKMVQKEKETILDVYLDAATHPCSANIRREAMSGILKFLPYLSSMKTPTACQMALLVQSFFDDENPHVRQNALEIFGHLGRFFYWRNTIFSDKVEKSLALLLIHLQDDDLEVAKTSKVTLQKCAHFVRYKPLRNLILSFLDNKRNQSITSLLMEVCKLLVQDWPRKLDKEAGNRAAVAFQLIAYLVKQDVLEKTE
ncbi:maestro heat-like repeat-containing protein family member 1 [Sceloporus undulatus]|uniref:maestro heat-like repeat-containing protein family member 1 n=1 Tax=Sceloporus undulatus TaxID=8520 RepID=UPI001C4B5700|nr:maestro heat-like repeat-containing protein family member 1 [Sceloporus undulatus]